MNAKQYLIVFFLTFCFSLMINKSLSQCNGLTNLQSDKDTYCVGDMMTLSLDGTNVPGGLDVEYYWSTNQNFDPESDGTLIGTKATAYDHCEEVPQVASILLDGCGDDEDAEYVLIESGGGFFIDEFSIELYSGNTGFGGIENGHIGVSPCSWTIGDNSLLTGCSNVIALGPNDFVPANSILFVQTSMEFNQPVDISSICSANPIYVIRNSCVRTGSAFSNFNASAVTNLRTYTFDYGCADPHSFTYDITLIASEEGSYIEYSGNSSFSSCATSPQASPPASITNYTIDTAIDDLDYTIPETWCGSPIYIKAIINEDDLYGGCTVISSLEEEITVTCPPEAQSTSIDQCADLTTFDLESELHLEINNSSNVDITWYDADPTSAGTSQIILNGSGEANLSSYEPGSIWAVVTDKITGCTNQVEVPFEERSGIIADVYGDLNVCESGCAFFYYDLSGGSGEYNLEMEFTIIGFPIPHIFAIPPIPFTLNGAQQGVHKNEICFGDATPSTDSDIVASNSLPICYLFDLFCLTEGDQIIFSIESIVDANTGQVGELCNTTQTITFLEDNINITADIEESCGNSENGQLDITVTDAENPYDIQWSNGSTIEDQINLDHQTYTVTVSDDHGCNSTESFTINEATAAIPTFNIESLHCVGMNALALPMTSDNGYSGNWLPAQISTASSGMTDYTFTPSVGPDDCVTSAMIQIEVIDNPTIQQSNVICDGANYTFDITVTGTSNMTYQLSGTAVTTPNPVSLSTNFAGEATASFVIPFSDGSTTLIATLDSAPSCTSTELTINPPTCVCPTLESTPLSIQETLCHGELPALPTANTEVSLNDYSYAGNIVWTTDNVSPESGGSLYNISSPLLNLTCNVTSTTLYGWLECLLPETTTSYIPVGSAEYMINPDQPTLDFTINDSDVCSGQIGVITYRILAADGSICQDETTIDADQNETCSPININRSFTFTNLNIRTLYSVPSSTCTTLLYTDLVGQIIYTVYPADFMVTESGDTECGTLKAQLFSSDGSMCNEQSLSCVDNTTTLDYDFSNSLGFIPLTDCPYTDLAGSLNCDGCVCPDPVIVDAGSLLPVCPEVDLIIDLDDVNASIGGATSDGIWSGGTGVIGSGIYSNSPTYTVSQDDIDAGLITLILTSDQPTNSTCTQMSDELIITFLPAVEFESNTTPSCIGLSTGNVSLTITSGESPYSYNWSNNAIPIQVQLNMSAGTYQVTVTDSNTCSTTSDIVIEEHKEIEVTINPSNESCIDQNDGVIELTVDDPSLYNFDWSDDTYDGQALLTNLDPATYTVTIRDNNNCQRIESITIEQGDALTMPIFGLETTYCTGDLPITLPATSDHGITGNWSSTNITSGILGYTFTPDDDCSQTYVLNTLQLQTPTLTVSMIECTGMDYIATVNISGDPNSTYNLTGSAVIATNPSTILTNASGNAMITYLIPQSTGDVTLQANLDDPKSCSSEIATIIAPNCICANPIIVEAGSPFSICPEVNTVIDLTQIGASITGDVTNGIWSGGLGQFDSQMFSDATAYTVNQDDINNGSITLKLASDTSVNPECSDSEDEIIITFLQQPDNVMIENTYCSQSGQLYQSDSGVLYGENNPTDTEILTDVNGCTYSLIINLNYTPLPSISVEEITCSSDMNTYSVVYNNLTGQIDAISNGSLQNDAIDGIPIAEDLVITISTNGMCEELITIASPDCSCPSVNPPISLGDQSICEGEAIPNLEVNVNSGQSAQWYRTSSLSSLLHSGERYRPSSDGRFYVIAVDNATGCPSQAIEVILNIYPEPNATIINSACNTDFATYQVELEISSSGTMDVTSDHGIVIQIDNQHFTIEDIPLDQSAILNITNRDTNCETILPTIPPDCTCNNPIIVNAGTEVDVCIETFTIVSLDMLNASISGAVTEGTWSTSGTGTFDTQIYTGATVYYPSQNDLSQGNVTLVLTSDIPMDPTCNFEEDYVDIRFIDGVSFKEEVTPSCFEQDNGLIDLTITQGESPIIYNWNGGLSPQEDQDNVIPGFYLVTVTDDNGCSSTNFIEVSELPELEFDVLKSDESCIDNSDGSISITMTNGQSPYTIDWTDNSIDGMMSVENLSPNTYPFIITDNLGCIAGDSITINPGASRDILTFTLADSHCFMSSTNPLPLVSDNGITGSWNPSVIATNFIGSNTYVFTPSSEECADEYLLNIDVVKNPTINIRNIQCNGTDYSFEIEISGSNNSVYELSGTAITPSNTNAISTNSVGIGTETFTIPLSTGNVNIQAILNNQPLCESTLFDINQPNCDCINPAIVEAGQSPFICAEVNGNIDLTTIGASITGGATDGKWQGGLGTFDSTIFSSASIYTISQDDIDNGSITLTLISDQPSSSECDPDEDQITLFFAQEPTIRIDEVTCSDDLLTYAVTYTTNSQIDTHTAGSNDQIGIINGIPIGENLIITISSNGLCPTEKIVESPSCECPTIPPPIQLGDQLICEDAQLPILEVTVESGLQVNWYSDADGLNQIGTGSQYLPMSQGTYYAGARDMISGCSSEMLTAINLSIQDLPQYQTQTNCTIDGQSYDVELTLIDSGLFNVTHNQGDLTRIDEDHYLITSISIVDEVSITVGHPDILCESTTIVEAPNCTCPTIRAPLSLGDVAVCDDNNILPVLEVDVELGLEVIWYDDSDGLNQIGSGVSFMPSISGSYFAQAIDMTTGCVSSLTVVNFTAYESPQFLTETVCSIDGQSYDIEVTIINNNIFNVVSDQGVLTQIDEDHYLISSISILDDVSITVGPLGILCETSIIVEPPNCACPTIEPPLSLGDVTVCDEGNMMPILEVDVQPGLDVIWYDDSNGLNQIGSGVSFMPRISGSYFAQAIDMNSGCVSSLTVINFTTYESPQYVTETVCSIDGQSYDVEITIIIDGIFYVASDEGSTIQLSNQQFLIGGIDILNPITITVGHVDFLCQSTTIVEAPNCNCPSVNPPISLGDQSICEGEAIPSLSVMIDDGHEAYWYGDENLSTVLETGNIYQPDVAGTYYAIAIDNQSGCSSQATQVELAIIGRPQYNIIDTQCSDDESTYSIAIEILTPEITVVNTDIGSVNVIDNQNFTIENIPIGQSANVEIRTQNGDCRVNYPTTSPNCSCPSIRLEYSSIICIGDVIEFNLIEDDEFTDFEFQSEGDGTFESDISTGQSIYIPGIYDIRNGQVSLMLEANYLGSNDNCQDFEEVYLIEIETIQEDLMIMPSKDETQPNVYNLDFHTTINETEFQSILWTSPMVMTCTDCQTPSITLTENTSLELTIETIDGCLLSEVIPLVYEANVTDTDMHNVFMPNIFNPDVDASLIYPQSANNDIIISYRIFDRWGNLVYFVANGRTNDPTIAWDGTYKGDQIEQGVYLYVLRIEFLDGNTELISGDLTIVR